MLRGVTANMVTPIELIQRAVDGMVERRFGRIVNITSVSVRMPVFGLDLSSGARAGLTAFLAGVARSVAHANRSEEHTSELQSLMRSPYAVFCLKKTNHHIQ